jgi:hypothetical protein
MNLDVILKLFQEVFEWNKYITVQLKKVLQVVKARLNRVCRKRSWKKIALLQNIPRGQSVLDRKGKIWGECWISGKFLSSFFRSNIFSTEVRLIWKCPIESWLPQPVSRRKIGITETIITMKIQTLNPETKDTNR